MPRTRYAVITITPGNARLRGRRRGRNDIRRSWCFHQFVDRHQGSLLVMSPRWPPSVSECEKTTLTARTRRMRFRLLQRGLNDSPILERRCPDDARGSPLPSIALTSTAPLPENRTVHLGTRHFCTSLAIARSVIVLARIRLGLEEQPSLRCCRASFRSSSRRPEGTERSASSTPSKQSLKMA